VKRRSWRAFGESFERREVGIGLVDVMFEGGNDTLIGHSLHHFHHFLFFNQSFLFPIDQLS
jgi:hypothetical protein